jgi:very-short-patch-repair endonuclease
VRLERALAELATRQYGVVSLGQLKALGLGARAVQQRSARGRLHRVHRGVYAVGHRVLSADGHRIAAVLGCGPGAVLSHRSAAAAWGIRPTDRERIEVSARGQTGRRGPAEVELHRPRALGDPDVTTLRGIPITTVARTLVDLAAVLQPHQLERAVHQAEVLRLLDVRAVREATARAGNRKGTRHLDSFLSVPSPGPTRSVAEERFLQLVTEGGLPTPRLNAYVEAGGKLIQVDALWPNERVVVEIDGAAAHATRQAFEDDRRRDAALAAAGYVVVRLTWTRMTTEASAVQAQLHSLIARRAGTAAAR